MAKMAKGFFITGTDTEIGKTTASLVLMRAFKQKGYKVAGMKPVAAGCQATTEGLRNDDAQKLLSESSIDLPYELVNPFAYEPPIAPHIAAAQADFPVNIDVITNAYGKIATQTEIVIVEGVGGWAVPINEHQTMANVAKALNLPVILVSGIRLGCLNHTLLTYEAISSRDCGLAGWIANLLSEDNAVSKQNIEYIIKSLPEPYLGTIPYFDKNLPMPEKVHLNIDLLL
jgi:dethiobiotin synthetase